MIEPFFFIYPYDYLYMYGAVSLFTSMVSNVCLRQFLQLPSRLPGYVPGSFFIYLHGFLNIYELLMKHPGYLQMCEAVSDKLYGFYAVTQVTKTGSLQEK